MERLGINDNDVYERHLDPSTWKELEERFEKLIGGKTLNEWSEVFADCDACVAPVLTPEQAASHAHLAARGTWTEVDGQLQARSAPRFDGKRPADPGAAPIRGEHTTEILASLDTE